MPLYSSILLLCIASLGGYVVAALFTRLLFRPSEPKNIAGLRLHGLLPAIVPGFSGFIAAAIEQHLRSSQSLEKAIEDPALLQQLKPEMENHIEIFLRDKLPIAFPLLAGMMGEKTKASLKAAFLEEVETIFPSVMKSFSGEFMARIETASLIKKKLGTIDWKGLEKMLHVKAGPQMLSIKLAGAVAGLGVGLVQLAIIHYLGS